MPLEIFFCLKRKNTLFKYRPPRHCKILFNMFTCLCKNVNYLPVLHVLSIHTTSERKKYQNLWVYLTLSNIYCDMNVKDIRTYSSITYAKSPSFSWQHSAQVSQILRSSYLSYVNAAMTWWMNTCTSTSLSCRKQLIYTHKTSQALPTCDSSLDLLSLRASEAGDVVEFLVLQWVNFPGCCSNTHSQFFFFYYIITVSG